jgi:hypothetical protein
MKWQSVFLVILLIVGVIIVVSIGESYSPQKNPYSSRETGYTGTLAFYLLLEEYTDVRRIETSLENRTLESGTFIMVEPLQKPSHKEMEYLDTWVRQGNRVLVFTSDLIIAEAFGVPLSAPDGSSVTVPPVTDHWSTQDVRAIHVWYDQYFTSPGGTVLFADGDKPLVVAIKKGEGELIMICTPSVVQNYNINEMDNEIFLVQAALSDVVYFDEYHSYILKREHGINLESLKVLFSGYTPFFIQLLLACALFLVAYGKRFGVPRPYTPPEVQSSELVVFAANLYYKGKKKEILDILDK